MAERSYPTRGRSREDPMPEGRQPIGVTPRLRSGAVAKSARLQQRRNGREELPYIRGQGGGREEIPCIRGQGGDWDELPHAPTPEARGGGREDQPHFQGAVAARV